MKRNKNTISLPQISNKHENKVPITERIKGFTGAAKNQAAERKKLEKYFKSLDKAVQILRQKRQNELASRPWVPTGPLHTYQYRPTSKLGK